MCAIIILSLLLTLLAAAVPAAAELPGSVAGSYMGWVQLPQEGKTGPGDKIGFKIDLEQQGQQLRGMVTVGDRPEDQLVFQINRGQVDGSYLWFEADELLWRMKLTGELHGGLLKGQALFVSQDPARKLLGAEREGKGFQHIQMQGPFAVTRR
jgi:hypothetical protein